MMIEFFKPHLFNSDSSTGIEKIFNIESAFCDGQFGHSRRRDMDRGDGPGPHVVHQVTKNDSIHQGRRHLSRKRHLQTALDDLERVKNIE